MKMDFLKSCRYNIHLVLNYVNDHFHESGNGIGYLVSKHNLFLMVMTTHYKDGCEVYRMQGLSQRRYSYATLEQYLENNSTADQTLLNFSISQ